MARGVNKVILVGNLGNDPEVKYTQGGTAVASISLATTSSRKDRDGNRQDKTEWHRVKFFGKVAEIVGEYLHKGSQVYVEGRIEYGSYDKDGVTVYTTEIIGDDMQMMGSADGQRSQAPSRAPQQRSAPAQRQAPARQAPARPQRQAPPPQQDFGDDFADDDIPF